MESTGWVVHTLQVQSALHQVEPDLIAYNRYLRKDWTAGEHPASQVGLSDVLRADAAEIQRLTADNPSQQRHVKELRALLFKHGQALPEARPEPIGMMAETQLAQRTQGVAELLRRMDAEEVDLLRQRQNQTLFTEKRIVAGLIAETVGGVLLSGFLFLYYTRLEGREAVLEQASQTAQATVNAVMECTSDCVMTIGYDWSLVYGNRQTLESLPDFKVGEDYWKCFPDVAGTAVEDILRNAMFDREPETFENFYAPYGRWFKVQVFPTDRGLNVFFSDITGEKEMLDRLELEQLQREERIEELRRMSDELARVNGLLTSVMDSPSQGIVKLDPTWRILCGNRAAMQSLSDFRVDTDFWECFPALLSTHAEERLRTAMEERIETQYEVFYAPYDGWFSVHVFPTGRGVSLFFSNITAEKKLKEQLEHEQLLREKRIEALSHMAGGLAHEISNPLAIIHGRATELLDMAAGEAPVAAEDVRAACDDIVKTSNRASSILRGLRGFAREAGQDEMQLASIYDIAEESVELQQSRADRHDVELRVSLDADLPLLLCRETQIGQILTNLLNNGFDAIVQSESVTRWVALTAACDRGNMVIEVTDSGPGIEDHFKSHLMEAFFTTKEFGLGMGVGLSLSRAIAQDHGGTLTLCSDTKNTCFQLVLPIVQDAAEVDAEPVLAGVSD